MVWCRSVIAAVWIGLGSAVNEILQRGKTGGAGAVNYWADCHRLVPQRMSLRFGQAHGQVKRSRCGTPVLREIHFPEEREVLDSAQIVNPGSSPVKYRPWLICQKPVSPWEWLNVGDTSSVFEINIATYMCIWSDDSIPCWQTLKRLPKIAHGNMKSRIWIPKARTLTSSQPKNLYILF